MKGKVHHTTRSPSISSQNVESAHYMHETGCKCIPANTCVLCELRLLRPSPLHHHTSPIAKKKKNSNCSQEKMYGEKNEKIRN